MRAELQPNIDSKISDGIDSRRKLDGLPDASGPMCRVTSAAGKAIAGDRAEEGNGFRLWNKIG